MRRAHTALLHPSERFVRIGFALLVASCLLGCPDNGVDLPPVPHRGGPEPILPSPSSSADAQTPTWMDRLPAPSPDARLPAAVGDRVWASTPLGDSEMVDVAIYTVSGIFDGLFALTGRTGQRIDGVHPALVHPALPLARLANQDIVLFYTPSTPAFLGRAAEVVGGAAIQIRYDQGGVTAITEADHVQQPVQGVKPLAYVGFPKAGATSLGLVIATVGSLVWLRAASGHVEVHDAARVEALPLPSGKLSVGDAVRAFRWATGFQPGVVTAIQEDGLRYEVTRDERRKGSYFFSSVLASK